MGSTAQRLWQVRSVPTPVRFDSMRTRSKMGLAILAGGLAFVGAAPAAVLKSLAPIKKVCLPERSTRPIQRRAVPWQWGRRSGEVSGV